MYLLVILNLLSLFAGFAIAVVALLYKYSAVVTFTAVVIVAFATFVFGEKMVRPHEVWRENIRVV